jgi:carboxylesterase
MLQRNNNFIITYLMMQHGVLLMSSVYMEGAEPLFLQGSKSGCLLLHGAGGGTTWDLKEFANVLQERTGMTVWLPALKGFGTTPEDLYEVTFDDWLANSIEGVEKLQHTCDQICIVGHSMGGLLALITASKREGIDAIVTWAAPFGVQSRMLSILPVITRIPLLKRIVPETYPTPTPDWLREQGWIGYDFVPTSLGYIALEAMKRLKESLKDVTCPVLLVQGSVDQAVSHNSARKIHDKITSKKKEFWIIEGAAHPIMNELKYKDELFSRTISFLEEHT